MLYGKKVMLREYRESDLKDLLNIINEKEYKKNVASKVPYLYTLNDM